MHARGRGRGAVSIGGRNSRAGNLDAVPRTVEDLVRSKVGSRQTFRAKCQHRSIQGLRPKWSLWSLIGLSANFAVTAGRGARRQSFCVTSLHTGRKCTLVQITFADEKVSWSSTGLLQGLPQ